MKELYLIRHAKSSWDDSSLSDFDRPLNNRGERDAPMMGKVLAGLKTMPDAIVSSPANRAITTAHILAEEIGFPTSKIIEEKGIYEASTASMLELINGLNDSLEKVFLVGHNPTFTVLAEQLTSDYFGNLPTCGIIGIRFTFDEWKLISGGTGDNFYYGYPKRYQ